MRKIYYSTYKRLTQMLACGKIAYFEDRGWGETGSTFSTSDPRIMADIENLTDFKRGRISIYATFEDKPKVKAPKLAETLTFDDVKRVQDAIEVVKRICAERGVACGTIRSRAAVESKAKELGVEFPNL